MKQKVAMRSLHGADIPAFEKKRLIAYPPLLFSFLPSFEQRPSRGHAATEQKRQSHRDHFLLHTVPPSFG